MDIFIAVRRELLEQVALNLIEFGGNVNHDVDEQVTPASTVKVLDTLVLNAVNRGVGGARRNLNLGL